MRDVMSMHWTFTICCFLTDTDSLFTASSWMPQFWGRTSQLALLQSYKTTPSIVTHQKLCFRTSLDKILYVFWIFPFLERRVPLDDLKILLTPCNFNIPGKGVAGPESRTRGREGVLGVAKKKFWHHRFWSWKWPEMVRAAQKEGREYLNSSTREKD